MPCRESPSRFIPFVCRELDTWMLQINQIWGLTRKPTHPNMTVEAAFNSKGRVYQIDVKNRGLWRPWSCWGWPNLYSTTYGGRGGQEHRVGEGTTSLKGGGLFSMAVSHWERLLGLSMSPLAEAGLEVKVQSLLPAWRTIVKPLCTRDKRVFRSGPVRRWVKAAKSKLAASCKLDSSPPLSFPELKLDGLGYLFIYLLFNFLCQFIDWQSLLII